MLKEIIFWSFSLALKNQKNLMCSVENEMMVIVGNYGDNLIDNINILLWCFKSFSDYITLHKNWAILFVIILISCFCLYCSIWKSSNRWIFSLLIGTLCSFHYFISEISLTSIYRWSWKILSFEIFLLGKKSKYKPEKCWTVLLENFFFNISHFSSSLHSESHPWNCKTNGKWEIAIFVYTYLCTHAICIMKLNHFFFIHFLKVTKWLMKMKSFNLNIDWLFK